MGINYEETFCAAVDEIVSQRIQGLSFNATLICKIVDASDAENGIYTVNDGSVEFAAYSSNTSYQENDQVYVIVPNNNREEQCLIIGKKMYSGSTSYTFTSPLIILSFYYILRYILDYFSLYALHLLCYIYFPHHVR